MQDAKFQDEIAQGIPSQLPQQKPYPKEINSAPKRKDILSPSEKKLALRNALRYFPVTWHEQLASEFLQELQERGHIYMYRFKPTYDMYARPIEAYPAKSIRAAAIMLMIQNNLDPEVAQHPMELITYGGNGAVFQNWAQYLLTMHYLAHMTDEQTLHLYSGHPMGLFPSSAYAPRVVVSNGMMIPNYSSQDDLETYNALGVTQYGQMTAGSFMYIGPQGIVHGTTITLMNAFRKVLLADESPAGKIFLTSGLGGMSGAQAKAGKIVGCITICAEINPQVAEKRYRQGWVDELIYDLDILVQKVKHAQKNKEIVSFAFIGNVVDLWKKFLEEKIFIHIGTDQTSLHNPYSGGYYPQGLQYDEARAMISAEPSLFKKKVQTSLREQVRLINEHTLQGSYFFDYGNAFLLESSRAQADILYADSTSFKYPSYVQDILGPLYFDYGFGPFRWVCTSGKSEDLHTCDAIACQVLENMLSYSPSEISAQLQDNITWIKNADTNKLVVGSQARILYADAEGRVSIAKAFNQAIREKRISAPIVLGRDHHDVSGTDSPFRETSNIYDGSRFTADMAIHNVIGDSFRGATWTSIHNGGGVGWGEVINGGFGLVLDGSHYAQECAQLMLFFDVNNGIARRAWARNKEAMYAIKREVERTPKLHVTLAHEVEDTLLDQLNIT